MSIRKDISGIRFKNVVAIRRIGSDKKGHSIWECRCDCGNYFSVLSNHLLTGNTGTCGCRNGHGMRNTRIYRTWTNMKARCYNPKQDNFKYYGARGIEVCREWYDDFKTFLEWSLSHGYSDLLTIDRINSQRGYYPENCRWISISENVKRSKRGGICK
jgi:hypothetical protein